MARPKITITHPNINSGEETTILTNKVTVSGKTNTKATPYVNNNAPSQVHKQSSENLTYNIPSVKYTGASGTLNYSGVLELYKAQFDGTNPAVLKVYFGSNSRVLTSFSEITVPNSTYSTLSTSAIGGLAVSKVRSFIKVGSYDSVDVRVTYNYSDSTSSSSTFNATEDNNLVYNNPSSEKLVSTITFEAKRTGSPTGEDVVEPTLSGVTYSSTQILPAQDGTTNGINVILKDFSMPVDASDSDGGYLPSISLNFVETDTTD